MCNSKRWLTGLLGMVMCLTLAVVAKHDVEAGQDYEIGSYIMNKPQTMQNDGKYAVLFKYRGKTLFKLCIKEDAPVLYYSTDDGGKSEVKINSAEALEAARKIVDLRIAQTDSQM